MRKLTSAFCLILVAAVAGLAVASCGGAAAPPDPYWRAYTFTRMDNLMLTKPIVNNSTSNATGTITIEQGADYKFTMTDATTLNVCVLTATKFNVTNLQFTPGQTCTYKNPNNNDTTTFTLKAGSTGSMTAPATSPDWKLLVNLSYDVKGTSGVFAVEGTGTSTVTATPAM